jgi:hypothetical protein
MLQSALRWLQVALPLLLMGNAVLVQGEEPQLRVRLASRAVGDPDRCWTLVIDSSGESIVLRSARGRSFVLSPEALSRIRDTLEKQHLFQLSVHAQEPAVPQKVWQPRRETVETREGVSTSHPNGSGDAQAVATPLPPDIVDPFVDFPCLLDVEMNGEIARLALPKLIKPPQEAQRVYRVIDVMKAEAGIKDWPDACR